MIPERLELTYRGRTLVGSRHAAADSRGLAILNHGFSANRIGPQRFYFEIARTLAAAGIDVVAYDRLGQGESCGTLDEITLPDEIAQIEAMVDAHGQGRPVHLIGHSLGGMESACVAARLPRRIASLTLYAPAAYIADEITGGTVLGKPVDPIDAGGVVDHMGQPVGQPLVASVRAGFDPYAGLSAYTGPVQIHHGSQDEVIPMRYVERYARIWGARARLIRHDTDHGFSAIEVRKALARDTRDGILAVPLS
ncbi:alpha/beta fold hydrolase [Salipiger sp. IMCC34102]|uniref:alpha/beta hydrolase n=1 Tax=Salipiger sp. IMCC34102 TaxID=2510647 RepID=UPI00101D820F|nr:alpha/beta fold hydrolase [Salipiger sp. IMCC34102]RYH04388.1 alpha/beta fold hydrolase [Salipiger sp. IMCC34102]